MVLKQDRKGKTLKLADFRHPIASANIPVDGLTAEAEGEIRLVLVPLSRKGMLSDKSYT